jgi:hypothetical protein
MHIDRSPARLWRVILNLTCWIFLALGFLLVGKTIVELLQERHVTSNSLSWSTAALLLLLVGSLVKSCGKQLSLSSTCHPKD